MEQCQITWLGHSCFQIEMKGHVTLLDPYEDNYVPGLAPLRASAHEVLCSHDHHDHNAEGLIARLPDDGQHPFTITKLTTDHDTEQGSLRGKNTIHILTSHELRVAHFGDLGTAITQEQAYQLTDLDVAMIPVGGFYTIGPEEAKQLVAQLRPKVVIPMHYRSDHYGFPPLATVEEFLTLDGDCVWYPGRSLTVTRVSKPHVAVLTYQGGF